MSTEHLFLTPCKSISVEHRVKDSVFIGHISPCTEHDQAENFINEIRQKYTDATHNCFAFRIGFGDQAEYRFDDDGEPGGSAGRPILQAIESRDVSNSVIVVTRYFGGTKLGVGGLVRAYSGAAFATLDQVKLKKVIAHTHFTIIFNFSETGAVHNMLESERCQIQNTQYSEHVQIDFQIPQNRSEIITKKLTDATRGNIKIYAD